MLKKIKDFWGFTIAEMLIVMTIIGLVAVLGIASAKPYEKTTHKLYSRAYDVVSLAAYNYSIDLNSQEISSPEELCKGLAKYINSNAAISPKTGEEFNGNPNSGYCNNVKTRATDETQNFNAITPDFIANNGMIFYITKEYTTKEITDSSGLKKVIKYYIIYVDLDGEKGNGTLLASGNRTNTADVVAFALSEDSDIIPLGSPITNKNYLSARVVYPEDETHKNEHYSKNLTYYNAINKAWGGKTTFDDFRTFDFNTFLSKSSAITKDLTYPSSAPTKDSDCTEFDCDVKIQRYY
jgi:competence protein ComGC